MNEALLNRISHRTWVGAPITDVYRALSTPDGWNGWFTTDCVLELKKGGRFVTKWVDFGPDLVTTGDEGRVLDFERPLWLELEWYAAGPGKPTRVRFDLEERYGGTVVEVTDTGYPLDGAESQRVFLDSACAWGEALTLLKFYVEHGLRYGHPQPAD